MGNGSSTGQGRDTTYGTRDARRYSAETSYWPELAGAKLVKSSETGRNPHIPPIVLGMGKAYILYAHSYDRSEQKPIKNFGKSSRGRTQELSKYFRAPIYRAHRAVIFAVAQLSCSTTR